MKKITGRYVQEGRGVLPCSQYFSLHFSSYTTAYGNVGGSSRRWHPPCLPSGQVFSWKFLTLLQKIAATAKTQWRHHKPQPHPGNHRRCSRTFSQCTSWSCSQAAALQLLSVTPTPFGCTFFTNLTHSKLLSHQSYTKVPLQSTRSSNVIFNNLKSWWQENSNHNSW